VAVDLEPWLNSMIPTSEWLCCSFTLFTYTQQMLK
jgi:hypothetical protein